MTSPPGDAVIPPRSEHAPAPGDEVHSHYRWCYGCGVDHASGLHLRIFAGEGLTVNARFVATDDHQGAPGIAHGGLLSCALDEVLGSLNWLIGARAVTARLECDFRRPVPIGTELVMSGHVVGVHGRKVYLAGEARLGDDGPIAVTATAIFVQVPLEHFTTHGDAAKVAEAIAERASVSP